MIPTISVIASRGHGAVRDTEKIIDQFEQQLKRKLTHEERRLLRLAFAAYPPCDDEEDDPLANAGD